VYLGKHYPLDVIAGAAVGVVTGFGLQWLMVKIVRPQLK
jgi:membrane-associated phospholipid phosphatase